MNDSTPEKTKVAKSRKARFIGTPEVGANPYGKRVYTSHVDEWHRIIKLRRLIRTTSRKRSEVWTALLNALSVIYKSSANDFGALDRPVRISEKIFIVQELEPGRELVLRSKEAKKVATKAAPVKSSQNARKTKVKTDAPTETSYILRFTLRQNLITRRVNVMYSDTAISPRTLFGLKDTMAKYLYWRNARYNVRLLAKELRVQLTKKLPSTQS